ncbi:MAG: extracellular solute-binding protein [Hyphomicrobiaceae bacterium]
MVQAEPVNETEPATKSEPATAKEQASEPLQARNRVLRVASWGGAYGKAQTRAIIEPVRTELDILIERVAVDDEQPEIGQADVLEVNQSSLVRGCRSGAFARIQPIDLSRSPNGGDGAGDFIADGVTDCGVATFAWSALVLFDGAKFRRGTPRTLSDVFDTKRFPGKRAFPKRMENLLEMLAVASGIDRANVYEALLDRKALDKIFARLEKLLPHIVWSKSAGESVALLERGKARFALAYSGRAFRKTIAGRLTAIWDGHIYDHGSWVISARARDQELAKSFITLATSPKMLAAQARIWPYGPMRKSAAAMAGRHSLLDVELSRFMPTSEARLPAGLRRNAEFWLENSKRLNDRLATLMEGFPIGIRIAAPLRRPEPPPPPIPPLPERSRNTVDGSN